MRWLKLNIEEAKNFNMVITEAIQKALPYLKLEIGRDIRDYLNWVELAGFTYIAMGLYDLEHKNRIYDTSETEEQMWDKVAKANNWQVVYDVEQVGEIV